MMGVHKLRKDVATGILSNEKIINTVGKQRTYSVHALCKIIFKKLIKK